MLGWHVAFTGPNQEIRASIEITQIGYHVFFPLKSELRVRHNRPSERVNMPLFPRYIFVRFNNGTDEWGKISDCRGVCTILKNGHTPLTVKEEIIESIREYREPEVIESDSHNFVSGQRVRINTGVLQGIDGLFRGSNRQRTRAFLEILGKPYDLPMNTIIAA